MRLQEAAGLWTYVEGKEAFGPYTLRELRELYKRCGGRCWGARRRAARRGGLPHAAPDRRSSGAAPVGCLPRRAARAVSWQLLPLPPPAAGAS